MLRTSVVLLLFLVANFSLWAQQEEPDLWIYEYKEVVDSVKADSLYEAYKATLKERMTKMWTEPVMNIMTAIDALMEYEKSGNKIEPSNYLLHHLFRFTKNKEVTEKERKSIHKGKVPKGFTEKVLLPTKAQLQAKIDAYNPQMPSWDDVFKYHQNRYEIKYTSNEYMEFGIGNLDGPRTRFVNMETVTLPHKEIAFSKPNPECRDNYFNGNFKCVNGKGMDILYTPFTEYDKWAKQDDNQQSQGWEWLSSKDLANEMKYEKVYFPEELGYYTHPAHSTYRFIYYDNWGGWNVFDQNGKLVRIDNITKFIRSFSNKENVTKSILNQLCKRDFLANKYNINSANPKTLTALRIKFGLTNAVDARFKKYMKMARDARDEIVSATNVTQYLAAKKKQSEAFNAIMEYVAKEQDPKAINYVKQLKSDHTSDLSYLYKTERVNDTTFKFYFLNDNMQCGCIAQIKWSNKAPYEVDYEIELLPNEEIIIRR